MRGKGHRLAAAGGAALIATSALAGPWNVVERRAWATSARSWTEMASPCLRSSSSCAPWLNTVGTPLARSRSMVACAHWSGSARRIGPGRIETAGKVASNTANIPQLEATAPVLALIVEEAVVQDGYMNALTDGFGAA